MVKFVQYSIFSLVLFGGVAFLIGGAAGLRFVIASYLILCIAAYLITILLLCIKKILYIKNHTPRDIGDQLPLVHLLKFFIGMVLGVIILTLPITINTIFDLGYNYSYAFSVYYTILGILAFIRGIALKQVPDEPPFWELKNSFYNRYGCFDIDFLVYEFINHPISLGGYIVSFPLVPYYLFTYVL